MLVTYHNINDEKICSQELSSSSEYYKVFSENEVILKKEFYIDHILKHISHYKNAEESENDIITIYNTSNVFYSIIEKINLSNHVLEIHKQYSGTVLTSHSRYLYNNTNDLICIEHIDLLTGLPKFKETEKYFYDFEKDDYFPIITAFFNEDSSLDIIQYDSYRFDGQDEIIFSEDGVPGISDLPTLKKRLALSTQEMNYYLTAILEP